jgi:hypothetical protein
MNKTSLSIILALVLATVSVLGTSEYTVNSTGFHVFEDWDTFNRTMWYSMLPNWGLDVEGMTTMLTCEENYTLGYALQGGFILNNSNFNIGVNDTFIAELNYRYWHNLSASTLYASLGVTMTSNSQYLTSGTTDFAHNYDLCNNHAGSYTLEEWNGTGTQQWSTGAATGCISFGWNTLKFVRSFLPNGSLLFQEYWNGVFMQNHTGKYNWSRGDMPSTMKYYGIECYNNEGTPNHKWQMDWLNLTVTYGNAPAGTPNTPPVVTLTNPANASSSSAKQTVNFTAIDDASATTACNLYVNSILNLTNATVLNNTISYFAPNWAVGAHTFYITCSDGSLSGTSETRSFTYDRSLTVTSLAPANNTNSTTQQNITFSTADNKIATTSCTLKVNNVANQTNASVQNNTITKFIMQWSIGSYLWNISCNDGEITGNSETRNFIFSTTPINCTPSWSCIGFTACNISNLRTCNTTSDLNLCNESYTGNYSEFGVFACNYCSRDIILYNESGCSATPIDTICYLDNNFGVCCNVTKLGSDCYGDIVRNESIICGAEVCSIFAYTGNDIAPAVISGAGTGIITLAILSGAIVTLGIGIWLYHHFRVKP